MRRLLDHLIDGGLDTYVTALRADGKSWREIALAIRDQHGVDMTEQTLRNWFPNLTRAA